MRKPGPYQFRPARLKDMPMVSAWQALPHVARWWDDDPVYDAADLADPRVSQWIVAMDGTPFGYLQDYDVHGWADHHFSHLPPGVRDIDQFIGPAEMLGQGHGPGFIAQRMGDLFDAGAPVIAIDPHPDNTRAIAAYAKVGFRKLGAPRQTRWGLILPMAAHRRPV
ncbi:GNAT family N-acetyltransferase [Yoonia sp. R2-816]|uniref:GNAT family N-acetyltransferase n=1 Tax=Yoonia sp. R2-816 TaxID=3342638 RepID=UPI00372B1852